VIDPQKIYTDDESEMFCPNSGETIDRINKIIGKSTNNEVPIVYIRHIHKKDGSDIGHLFDFTGEPEEVAQVEEAAPAQEESKQEEKKEEPVSFGSFF